MHKSVTVSLLLLLALACNSSQTDRRPHRLSKPVPAYESSLNPDWMRRDSILRLTTDWDQETGGGVAAFERLTLDSFETLVKERFIELSDRQNEAPTAEQFLSFMRAHSGVLAHGYAVSPYRWIIG